MKWYLQVIEIRVISRKDYGYLNTSEQVMSLIRRYVAKYACPENPDCVK